MTIKELSVMLGVKPVTIYRRLTKNGVDIASLRNAGGDLTDEGASVIASLFDGVAIVKQRDNVVSQCASDDTLQVRVAVLEAKLQAAEDTINRLEHDAEGLRGERDRLLAMLEAEQRQRQQLLTDSSQDKRRGLFAWFRRDR